MGVDHPAGIIKNIVPIVMAGVLGIYGLIVAVIITQAVVPPSAGFGNTYSVYNGYTHVRFLLLLFVSTAFCLVVLLHWLVLHDIFHGRFSYNRSHWSKFNFSLLQFAAGLCCGLSCLAAGGTIGILGDAGVRAFGLKAENGRKWYWDASMGGGGGGGAQQSDAAGDDGGGGAGAAAAAMAASGKNHAEGANKLYVGTLIMLIFSEALALYGLIVALILSQHSYVCS
jgi:V-type H+-transporting ATPase 16kDa proteolipid subunit